MYHGEKLNSISHLVGAVFSLIALGALLTVSLQVGDPQVIIGFNVFGVTLVLLYTMSALYHGVRRPELKSLFKVLDHIAIYLLIAGTYTPFTLVGMDNESGDQILGIVWGLAIIGIASELFLSGRAIKVCQIIIYLGMGWACSVDLGGVREALPAMGFFWLFWGGIAYTVGIVFYLIDNLNWLTHAHGIWHLFVLTGSVCHFIGIIAYVR